MNLWNLETYKEPKIQSTICRIWRSRGQVVLVEGTNEHQRNGRIIPHTEGPRTTKLGEENYNEKVDGENK